MNKRLALASAGALVIAFIALSIASEQRNEALLKNSAAATDTKNDSTNNSELDMGKRLARDMATGEIILMASCLGKERAIPRSEMGNYIAAAVEKQGISRQELFDNWNRYWGYAKEAEKRNRTSCLG